MAKHAGVHTVREDHHVDQPGIVSLRTLAVIALVAILVLSWIKPVQMNEDEEPVVAKKQPTTKLQIGVKKRIENCQRKSRRGDLLYIHYRVSLTPDFQIAQILTVRLAGNSGRRWLRIRQQLQKRGSAEVHSGTGTSDQRLGHRING